MKKFILFAMLILSLFTVAACSGEAKDSANTAEMEKITVVLDYLPNTNHTGLYVAQKNGYFEEVGLEVEIIEPADNTVTTLIAAGKGDFGISYQEDVTYALTQAEPMPIKAIATIIQHNTSGFFTYADKNITRPKDFEGKTYTGWGAPSEEAVIKALMNADNADFSKLNIVLSDGSGLESLKDKVDIKWLFWAWDGVAAQQAGIPLNYIELSDFDERLDYYTPVIIAANDTIENKPEMIKKFLAAVTKGYEYCIENPEKAAEVIHEYVSAYDLEMLTESQKYLAGKYKDDAPNWGYMKNEVWDNYTEFMLEYGLIENGLDASEYYTNEFLPK